MKQVIRCVGCGCLAGLYKSYAVTITETPIVNGVVMAEVKYKAHMCKKCAEEADYKVKRPRSKRLQRNLFSNRTN